MFGSDTPWRYGYRTKEARIVMSWTPQGPSGRVASAATLPMNPPTSVPVDGLWAETWRVRTPGKGTMESHSMELWWRREGDQWKPYEPTESERRSHMILEAAESWHSRDRIAESMGRSFARLVPHIHVGGHDLLVDEVRSRWDPESAVYQVRLVIKQEPFWGRGTWQLQVERHYAEDEINAVATDPQSWSDWIKLQWTLIADKVGFSIYTLPRRALSAGGWYEATGKSRPPIDNDAAEKFWMRIQMEAEVEARARLAADEAEVIKMLRGEAAS